MLGRKESPTAAILDSRTLQSTPESGARAGYDGAKRRKDGKVHLAVDTLGHLLALCVTAAELVTMSDYLKRRRGLHFLAFVILMLKNVAGVLA
jgi:hypothetical protein